MSNGGVFALRVRVVWRTGVCCRTKGEGVCTASACCVKDGVLTCLQSKPIFLNIKEKIRAHRASSNVFRLFLTK